MKNEITQAAENLGRERGHAAATWVEIGSGNAATILQGIEDSDPAIMVTMPAPLSGEWTGESIPELIEESGLVYSEMFTDDMADRNDVDTWLDAYEEAFSAAYWSEIERTCRYHLA